jgi:hypothetical protein
MRRVAKLVDTKMDEIESLEQRLRSLSRAVAPAGLLQQLLTDIPDHLDFASQNRSRSWKLPFAAIAAALCVSATIAVFNLLHPSSTVDRERAVSAEYVMHRPILNQETDPCSILPPLPAS